MRTARILLITVVLTLTGIVIVYLRGEQARLARETSRLEAEAANLRLTLWYQQTEIARLRAPALIRRRSQDWKAGFASAADTAVLISSTGATGPNSDHEP